MKKVGVFILLVLLFSGLLSNFILAQGLDAVGDKINSVKDSVDKAQEYTTQSKWEYLWQEWQKIFLKNKYIAGINNFFKKINLFFETVLGLSYEPSVEFFILLVLWVFVFINLAWLLKQTPFMEKFPYLFSLMFTLFFAQIGLFSKALNALRNLWMLPLAFLDFLGETLKTVASVIFWVIVICLILYFLEFLLTLLAGYLKKKREKFEEQQQEQDKMLFHWLTRRFAGMFTRENEKSKSTSEERKLPSWGGDITKTKPKEKKKESPKESKSETPERG